MQPNIIHIQKWAGEASPTEDILWQLLESDDLAPFRWENNPYEVYMAHKHPYTKVIVVVAGSITFGFPIEGEPITLTAGDQLELPANLMHNAAVGADGVICLEAHRYEAEG